MFKVVLLETMGNIRKTFRGWRLVLFLILSLLIFSMDIIYEDTGEFNLTKFYITTWICSWFRPKVTKLNYLLPTNNRDRVKYMLSSIACCVLTVTIWYSIIYLIHVLIGNYSMVEAVSKLFCMDLFFIVLITIYLANTSYIGRITHKVGEKVKLIIGSILLLLVALMVTYISPSLKGLQLIGFTLFTYVCLIPCIMYVYRELKDMDTSYEKIKQPIKWWV